MSEPPDPPSGTPDTASVGTQCALCGRELSPSEYPRCRTVLIDETAAGGKESVRMVCHECFADLEAELTEPSHPTSGRSA